METTPEQRHALALFVWHAFVAAMPPWPIRPVPAEMEKAWGEVIPEPKDEE